MRVILFVLAFGLSAFQLAAQSRPAMPAGPTDRGSKLVGGSASVSHSDEGNGQTETAYQVTPYVLFFVMPRLAVGGQAGINYATFESGTSTGGGHSFGWLLGPAMRWHLPTSSTKLLPFVGVNLALSSIRIKDDFVSTVNSTTVRGKDGEVVAGLDYMLATHVALEGVTFFGRDELEISSAGQPSRTQDQSRIGLRFGISAFVF
jgi:hypothetical protein